MASISDTGTAKCSIAAAARLTGTSVETLRYYERAGAIVRPGRSAGGHRVYTDDDLAYIRFVRRLRATGMSMRVIADYTAMARAGTSTLAERRALLEAHRDELAGLIVTCRAHSRPSIARSTTTSPPKPESASTSTVATNPCPPSAVSESSDRPARKPCARCTGHQPRAESLGGRQQRRTATDHQERRPPRVSGGKRRSSYRCTHGRCIGRAPQGVNDQLEWDT